MSAVPTRKKNIQKVSEGETCVSSKLQSRRGRATKHESEQRQEAQELGAGDFCKRKSNGRGEGSGGCGREQAEERGRNEESRE